MVLCTNQLAFQLRNRPGCDSYAVTAFQLSSRGTLDRSLGDLNFLIQNHGRPMQGSVSE